MPPPELSPRELLLSSLPLLRDLVGFFAKRYRLNKEQTEELGSFVRLRLVEDDYAILTKWRRTTPLQTYLTVVVKRLFDDYTNQVWGKWRASAAAAILGPIALQLEELIHRDGMSIDEAFAVLTEKHGSSRRELEALLEVLPRRRGWQVPEIEPETPEGEALRHEQTKEAAALTTALAKMMRNLPARDRLLLRLRFAAGLSIAEIAPAMAEPYKRTYRRFSSLIGRLRRGLRDAGFDQNAVRAMLEAGPDLDFGLEGLEPAVALAESVSKELERPSDSAIEREIVGRREAVHAGVAELIDFPDDLFAAVQKSAEASADPGAKGARFSTDWKGERS